jgi:hypothetical protein
MPAPSRFNLSLLRSSKKKSSNQFGGTWADDLLFSRRRFLGLAATAGVSATLPTLFAGSPISVVRDGSKVRVLLHGKPRWTIDPAHFGPLARVSVLRGTEQVTISLRNATFPGTGYPAGFDALIERVAGSWLFHLIMDCGIEVEAPLVEWLESRVPANGIWSAGLLRPVPGFALAYREAPAVSFSPDWTFELQGHVSAALSMLRRRVHSHTLRISLNPDAQIAAGPSSPKTQFLLQRGATAWKIPLQRQSEQGWSLSHHDGQEIFDELLVEAMENNADSVTPIHTALLSQHPDNSATLKFFTGGGLVSDAAEPFHLPLSRPRIAFALRERPARTALIAELNRAPLWAHGERASYLLGATDAAPLLEVHDQDKKDAVPDLQPGLCAVCFPDDDVATNLRFPEPKPFRLTWAEITEPFEWLMGALHLSPSRHAFDAFFKDSPDPDHLLEMERPQDMLSLKFQFKNMWLSTGANAVIRLLDKNKEGQITVILPPQHVAEEAFFHTDDQPSLNDTVALGNAEVRYIENLKPTDVVDQATRTKATLRVDPDYLDPTQPAPKPPGDSIPRTRLSEPTRLVFTVPKGDTHIPFHLEDLLNWKEWTPQVVPVAHTGVPIDKYDKLPPIIDPGTDYTSIELPYRVKLSPSDLGRWAHSRKPAQYETGATELWHTRLAVAKLTDKGLPTGELDEDNTKDRLARAIWSLDFVPVNRTCSTDPQAPQFPPHYSGPTAADPFRMSLDAADRCELVHLTSNYQIPKPASTCIDKPINGQLLPPAPVSIENLILTSAGGYLKSIGVWKPAKIDANHQLTVEQWRHIATLGRDQYARVVYKGYLLPFGHRASLVKVTERKFATSVNAQNGVVAILHQRMFIVVHDPIKDFPVMGQPNGARQFPFKRVEAITLITPDIEAPPLPSDGKKNQSQSLFWPHVSGDAFQFHFRFTDSAGGVSDASLPVVFADAAVAQAADRGSSSATGGFFSGDAVTLYNAGKAVGADDDPWVSTDFSNQKMSFAPAAKPGDTQYDAGILAFQTLGIAATQNPLDLYANDLPYFYPAVQYARISSSSIKRVTNNNTPTRVVFFQDYLNFGFDPKNNRGEVFLQAHDTNILTLGFGRTTSVDKAGGLSNPDVAVAGFSRKSGPVGGRPTAAPDNKPPANLPAPTASLSTYSSGNFNPADFFGGLTSAKILGGLRLSDIIAPLSPGLASNLEKAPKMLEQSVFALEDVIPTIVGIINEIQSWSLPPWSPGPGLPAVTFPNPLATHLAPQAQRVLDAQAAVTAAHARTKDDENDELLLLADTLVEADADREFVAAVLDYISALEAAVSNPTALAEEALVELFTQLLSDAITSAGLQLETQFAQLLTTLQTNLSDSINSASTPFNQAIVTLENFASNTAALTISDQVRIIRDKITDSTAQKNAVLLFNEYAPDLAAIANVINAAKDIQAQVKGFPKNVSLSAIPSFFDSVGNILDDLLQIYQSAGFLGIVSANPAVVDEILSAEKTIGNLWSAISYLGGNATTIAQIASNVVTLENNCFKLAAKSEADLAKQLLQNLRQVQRGVASLDAYRPQLGGNTTNLADVRRLTQLLQKIQRQILSSLAALQNLIQGTGNNLIAVAQVTNVDLNALGQLLTGLATSLTVADALIGTGPATQPVERQITTSFSSTKPISGPNSPAVGDTLAGPLQAKIETVQNQLNDVRRKLATNTNDLGLKLLHYDLTLQIQDSFAAALEWSVLEPLADFKAPLDTLTSLNANLVAVATTISSAVGSALCTNAQSPASVWAAFVATIHPEPQPPGTDTFVYTLFKVSIDNVSSAFTNFCAAVAPPAPALPRPSLVLTRGQQLFAAFKALLNDVRTRITGLSALPQELLNQLVSFAEDQLATLISELPIPTSITLSYDWHPEIQPFEPVFLLDDGADFTVSANATIPVLNPGGASVDINAELTNFSINLIGSPSFVIVSFDSVKFTSHDGSSPNCQVAINTVTFGEDMSFVKSLADALNPSKGPFIELLDGAIVAGYRFAIDSLPSAGMTVMNLAIEVAVALPFNGDPVRCQFGISDQQQPFLLSFGIYGGGGFLQLQLGLDGVQLLQGALEFGLVADISIGPLQGSGFVVGGIYFRIAGSNSSVCGFVHAHGHMDIFGIISLDVDVYVSVCYEDGSVTGFAEFTVEVSILFFSESFSLQATYTFAGSGTSSGDEQSMLLAPESPSQIPELSRAAFLVTPDDATSVLPKSSPKDPVFVTKDVWKEYLSCFDLAS